MKRAFREFLLVVIPSVLIAVALSALISMALSAERSREWATVRGSYVAQHSACEACGGKPVEVHHVRPFHLWPESELDPKNLIALCKRCHLLIGHLGDYRASNPLVREDAARQLARIKARPYTREDAMRFTQQFSTAP